MYLNKAYIYSVGNYIPYAIHNLPIRSFIPGFEKDMSLK